MAGRPLRPKKDDEKQNQHYTGGKLVVLEPAEVAGWEPDSSWLKPTKDAWIDFWQSDVSQAVTSADRAVVHRLFEHRDMQRRAMARYRKQPYVDGSTGQPVTNPAFADAMKLESACVALEDRLGLSPKARAQLGLVIGQAQLTAADLNRMAQESPDDDSDETAVDAELLDEWAG